MQSSDRSGPNRLFDDFARLMTDAAGAAQGVRREAETVVKAQFERLIRDMDIASREELDVLRDMVAALRSQNDALAHRVAVLEGKSPAGASPAGPASAAGATETL
jgi:BMFP domain-containing protein YqiC